MKKAASLKFSELKRVLQAEQVDSACESKNEWMNEKKIFIALKSLQMYA